MSRPARWRCHTCAQTFTAWAAAEAHADRTRYLSHESKRTVVRRTMYVLMPVRFPRG